MDNLYEVYPNSAIYKGEVPLTYSYNGTLNAGQIVKLSVRNRPALGIVKSSSNNKSIKNIKPIENVVSNLPLPQQTLALINWIMDYYALGMGVVTSQFLPSYLLNTNEKFIYSLKKIKLNKNNTKKLPLNKFQKLVIDNILKSKQQHNLLMGETASGKTHVYIELIKTTLESGKSCLMLTPEIGLTPQLLDLIKSYIDAPIYVLHSKLTSLQRKTLWLQILLETRPSVVIGPRSALFAPIKNIGLIILDEQHDAAYHQSQEPRYSADRVAAQLAILHNARLVFGTATPKVQDYYIFKNKKLPIHLLPSLFSDTKHSRSFKIIDQRDHNKFTKSTYIADKILDSIISNKKSGKQTLLFLNRRGSNRLIACNSCGWQKLCQRCNVAMTFHADDYLARCHSCGWMDKPPLSCPDCSSENIIFKGIGTKGLVEELNRLLPSISLTRLDTDIKKGQRLENTYKQIKEGEFDVIIGTQMISKGLDLPRLKTVAVISADTSLYLPDFTSEEQTFQHINQVIGRVGRGHGDAEIFIQTYQPDSNAINFAVENNYQDFYKWQIIERQKYSYPPFVYIMVLTTEAKTINTAKKRTTELYEKLINLSSNYGIIVSQPAPKFIEQVAGKYRWQIIIRSKNRSILTEIKRKFGNNFRADFDPINLL